MHEILIAARESEGQNFMHNKIHGSEPIIFLEPIFQTSVETSIFVLYERFLSCQTRIIKTAEFARHRPFLRLLGHKSFVFVTFREIFSYFLGNVGISNNPTFVSP